MTLLRELTKSEKAIRDLICKGLSNKEIAKLLFIEEHSVKFHNTNMYKKLGIKTREQLIIMVSLDADSMAAVMLKRNDVKK